MKDHTPRQGYKPKQTTAARGGKVQPRASIGPSPAKPKLGDVPKPQNTQKPRMTPRDTNPTLIDGTVDPVATRATPRDDLTKNPF